MIALLLAISTLVSIAMPTVFAAGDATPSSTPADLQVDFSADFKAVGAVTDKFAHTTAAIWQGIRDGYPDTYKWKFLEDASGKLVNTAYPVRVFGNGKLFQMRPNNAEVWGYTPIVVKAPATGNYTLTVKFQDSASAADAQKFAAYLYELPADGLTKYNIASVTTAHTPMLEVNYESQKGTVNGTTTAVMREGKEYALVFAIYSDGAAETAEIRGFTLNFVDANVEDPTVPKVYQFENPDLVGTFLQNYAATLNDAYIAGTGNWRYEAASNASQFRVKDTHPGVTSNGNNKYESDGLQLIAGDKWWYAMRIQSPGEGKYDLTFTNVKSKDGAQVKVYFFKAFEVEEALGENAAA
jgi:hypothetical protein